jgi:AP-1 complex subunit beta-1
MLSQDAEKIVERVLPRLSHVNSAVVLSAVKVVLRMMDVVGNEDLVGAGHIMSGHEDDV